MLSKVRPKIEILQTQFRKVLNRSKFWLILTLLIRHAIRGLMPLVQKFVLLLNDHKLVFTYTKLNISKLHKFTKRELRRTTNSK